MNGRDCCLAIKHQVPDEDVYVSTSHPSTDHTNMCIHTLYICYRITLQILTFISSHLISTTQGNAIQCFLDYDESTCKKTWWRDILETKRVMIYENHEGFVSRDPIVEGAWPACEEKWGATHDLTTAVCRAQANVCIALDMSGSVCSPDFNSPNLCSDCADICLDEGYDKNTCCSNFRLMEEFGTNVMNELTHSGNLGTPDKCKL